MRLEPPHPQSTITTSACPNTRLRYDGIGSAHVHIASSVCFTKEPPPGEVLLSILKNGVSAHSSELCITAGDPGRVESTALHSALNVVNGDYLEIGFKYPDWLEGTVNVTVHHANLFAIAVPA